VVLAFGIAAAMGGCVPASPARSTAGAQPAVSASARFTCYEYHYDRNSLASSVLVGSSVLAISEAGHLLRFDRSSFALTGERILARQALVLAKDGSSSALVGFASGRIARTTVDSLDLRTVTVVPGVPLWMGITRRDELVVVYGQPVVGARSEHIGALSAYRVRAIASGREFRLDETPSAFLLDSQDRLWIGADYGEWGGALDVLDVKSGVRREVSRLDVGGTYGFVEPEPGVVWAFGGLSHMTLHQAFVAQLAPRRARAVYRFEGFSPFTERERKRWQQASAPRLPVSHVVAKPDGDFWILSGSRLIEANRKLGRFRKLVDLHLRYVPGRPDAVGSYPAVRSALLDGGRLVASTRLDGFITYENDRVSVHTVPDQLSGSPAWALVLPSGILFVSSGGGALRTHDGHWKWVELELSSEEEGLKLNPEDPPSTDADVVAARTAFAAYLNKPRRAPEAYRWDSTTELVATRDGLCRRTLDLATGCPPFSPPGVDHFVSTLARDDNGRLWLAGRGLWYVDAKKRAVSASAGLPFLADTTVQDLQIIAGKLVLMLGTRGVAILDPRDLVERAPDLPVSQWDGALAHEPKYGDGAVMIYFRTFENPSDDQLPEKLRKLRERLQRAVEASGLQAYEVKFTPYDVHYQTPDPHALANVLQRVLEDDALRDKLLFRMRIGPPGSRVVDISSRPPAIRARTGP
jgi:hypothetical protein